MSAVPNEPVKSAPVDNHYAGWTRGRAGAPGVNGREAVQMFRGNERLQAGIRRQTNEGSFQLANSPGSDRTRPHCDSGMANEAVFVENNHDRNHSNRNDQITPRT